MNLVAKSYQNCEQIGDVYSKDKRLYIKIKESCDRCGGHGSSSYPSWAANRNGICFKCNGDGYITKEVRVYSEKEYETLERNSERIKNQKEIERVANIPEINRKYKEKSGFKMGYITAVLGNTYSIKEELKELGAKFNKSFGWYFAGGDEPEGTDYEFYRVNWEDVSVENNEYIVLKNEDELSSWFKSQTTTPSNSKFQKEIGDKIEVLVTIVSVFNFTNKFGVTYLHNMVDGEGNVFVWSTSTKCLASGILYRLRGTVKDHKIYKDTEQTILTRCVVV